MLARSSAKAAPELELKFQLGPGAVEALRAAAFPLEASRLVHLHAVYFDTAGHALRDGGFSLRVRRAGDRCIQTLKHRGSGGLFERDEWEVEVPGPGLDLTALADTPVQPLLEDAPPRPIFTVDTERRIHVWTLGSTTVEVSFDAGRIHADGREDPIAELELELLEGEPADLYDLAADLERQAHLTLAFVSKAQRGYRLAGHDGVGALRAQLTAVGPHTSAGDAFRVVARDALTQIAGNAAVLQRSHDPEVLHQLRVGLRRLRAGLSIFRDLLDADGLDAARRETRWLAGEMGAARDVDVFLEAVAAADDAQASQGRTAFLKALRITQAEAYERALEAVRSARFRTLLLALGRWIEDGPWLRRDGPAQALRDGPVTALAAPVLDKLDHRLRRQARRFGDLDTEARHDLRKQAKKLRYAAAFFGDAFPARPRRRERYAELLRLVQDRLGELNDMAVAREIARAAVGRRSGELAFAAGFEIGRLTGDERSRVKAAAEALRRFRRTKVFWEAPGDLNLSPPTLRRA